MKHVVLSVAAPDQFRNNSVAGSFRTLVSDAVPLDDLDSGRNDVVFRTQIFFTNPFVRRSAFRAHLLILWEINVSFGERFSLQNFFKSFSFLSGFRWIGFRCNTDKIFFQLLFCRQGLYDIAKKLHLVDQKAELSDKSRICSITQLHRKLSSRVLNHM